MEWLFIYYFVVFYLGTILGSFINVIALDLQKLYQENNLAERNELGFLARHISKRYFWKSLMERRSRCDSCGATLRPYELFPIFSYALQRGVCRSCGDKIAESHMVIEIVAGVYFLGIFYVLFWQEAVWTWAFVGSVAFWFVVFGSLLVSALFDYRTKLLPDVTLYLAGILILGYQIVMYGIGAWWYLGAGILLALFFWSLWAISRGAWIGFADGKLGLIAGLLLGYSAGFTAIAIAFWTGAVVAIILLSIQKIAHKHWGIGIKSAVPFGPFLVMGIWYVFVTGTNLFVLV
ncbi:MAG: prepilin peptidase [Patescibacteria group bacterium]